MKDFIKGMDLSTLLELEQCHAEYYDGEEKKDVLKILKSCDVDTIRLRLWNDPRSPEGEAYGAGNNDLETTLAIGKRVTAAGFGVLLNFHYSDFWADPGKQIKPKAWDGHSVPELEQDVYNYTRDSLKYLLNNGVNITMIQVGNELTNGLLWPEGQKPAYENIARFVCAGLRACREMAPEIRLMIHLDNGGACEMYRDWFDHYFELAPRFLQGAGDIDYIGLSYYPFWHGHLDDLEKNMDQLAERYGKDLIVAEVSMGYTMEDYASYEGLSPEERKGYATKPSLCENLDYPMTVEGQTDFVRDFLNRVKNVRDGRGKGFFWWEPAWIPVPGSGWATPASLAYMKDPGPCGNEWANQALFDYDGKKLPALEVIRDFHG
ncbi:MAG: glycosyl hydrolase 53 family protein [Lachnospiraceae bacterium]|nr:glycosyl hydrolase 53 family protein [Lachnospiraceae bacterium]